MLLFAKRGDRRMGTPNAFVGSAERVRFNWQLNVNRATDGRMDSRTAFCSTFDHASSLSVDSLYSSSHLI